MTLANTSASEREMPSSSNVDEARTKALEFERLVNSVIVGQDRTVRLLTLALFARGHVLLEGDVGVGKTTLLRAAAHVLGGAYARIEGTIDLMPSDMIYHAFLGDDGRPRVEPGPVLRHGENLSVFFFNEINRARPQVHSLLLRLMAERSVTAFNKEYNFPHLLVFADRNRIEREETFELPAAARDRFLMEIPVRSPTDDDVRRQLIFETRFHDVDTLIEGLPDGQLDFRSLNDIAKRIQSEITISPALETYVLQLWHAIRYPDQAGLKMPDLDVAHLVAGGASPRGLSYLIRVARTHAWLNGRSYVEPDDIRNVFPEVMGHRIFLQPVYELRREEIVPSLIEALFSHVAVP